MNKLIPILFLTVLVTVSCTRNSADSNRTPLIEVKGNYLYQDELQKIIPPNVSKTDSAEIAQGYIRKWVTEVLMYENAKRNITDKTEIEELVESYRKSLTIHQYQQKMIQQRLPKEPTDEEIKAFYDQYNNQLTLKENIVKGLLLIVPAKAPKLANVRAWVQSGNTQSLENIEKYSIQNAISYDYFGDRWITLSEVLNKMPLKIEDPAGFVSSKRFIETSDSTQHYFLRIMDYRITGQVEPFDMARDRISNILLYRRKADFISQFENELYEDAVKKQKVKFLNK